jgi:hypothetical protein
MSQKSILEKPKLSLKTGKTKKPIAPEDIEEFGNQAPVVKSTKNASPKIKSNPKAKPKAAAVKTVLRSFKFFEDDDASLNDLILRAAVTARVVPTKTDMVRAGIVALTKMTDKNLAKVLGQVRQTKPGPSATK